MHTRAHQLWTDDGHALLAETRPRCTAGGAAEGPSPTHPRNIQQNSARRQIPSRDLIPSLPDLLIPEQVLTLGLDRSHMHGSRRGHGTGRLYVSLRPRKNSEPRAARSARPDPSDALAWLWSHSCYIRRNVSTACKADAVVFPPGSSVPCTTQRSDSVGHGERDRGDRRACVCHAVIRFYYPVGALVCSLGDNDVSPRRSSPSCIVRTYTPEKIFGLLWVSAIVH